jgi:hypothetical protein
MDIPDLSRRFTPRALLRLAKRYRKKLIAGGSLVVAAVFAVMLAIPALADEGETKTPPPACDFTTLPLTAACAAIVTAPAATAGDYFVTLPGGGTLTISIDGTGVVTGATVAGLTGFTASVPVVDKDGDKVKVTLTSTDGTQVINVSASVKPPATPGGPATVKAKAKPGEKEDADEANEAAEGSGSTLSEHKGGGGGDHHHEGGGDH